MVLWLRQTAHNQEVVSSSPDTVFWMDVSDASYYIEENNENKGSQMRHTKKKYLRNNSLIFVNTEIISFKNSPKKLNNTHFMKTFLKNL